MSWTNYIVLCELVQKCRVAKIAICRLKDAIGTYYRRDIRSQSCIVPGIEQSPLARFFLRLQTGDQRLIRFRIWVEIEVVAQNFNHQKVWYSLCTVQTCCFSRVNTDDPVMFALAR